MNSRVRLHKMVQKNMTTAELKLLLRFEPYHFCRVKWLMAQLYGIEQGDMYAKICLDTITVRLKEFTKKRH